MNQIWLVYVISEGEYSDNSTWAEIEGFDTLEALGVRWQAIVNEYDSPRHKSCCRVESIIEGTRHPETDIEILNAVKREPRKRKG